MKYIKTFEQFIDNIKSSSINEANLSDEFLKFSPGDTVIVTKGFNPNELNFKKSARTIWGKYISSVLNLAYSDNNVKYKKDDFIFIFTKPTTIDRKNKANITGYSSIHWLGSDKYSIDFKPSTWNYDEGLTQVIILAILEGYAKIVKYNSLSDNIKNEIEAPIKHNRINKILKNQTVIIKELETEITELVNKKDKLMIKGFNTENGDKIPDKLINNKQLLELTFIDSKNNKEITGDLM